MRPSGAKSFGYAVHTCMCARVFSRSAPPLTWQACRCEAGGKKKYFYCLHFLPLFAFISPVVGGRRRLLSHYPGNKSVAVD